MSNARLSILQARAVKDKRITDAQFRTLAALGMYADEDGWCFPSLTTIGEDLGKSKQAVGRDTIALKRLGYLQVKARFDKNGSRRSNLYRLRFDLPPRQPEVDTPSTSEVDTPSTSEVDVNDPINDPQLTSSDEEKNNIKKFLNVFRDTFGKFHGERELNRFIALGESLGDASKLIEIVEWAFKREIHLSNRGGLLDSLETAAKNWRGTVNAKVGKPKSNRTADALEAYALEQGWVV